MKWLCITLCAINFIAGYHFGYQEHECKDIMEDVEEAPVKPEHWGREYFEFDTTTAQWVAVKIKRTWLKDVEVE